jgi:hypothetical protein
VAFYMLAVYLLPVGLLPVGALGGLMHGRSVVQADGLDSRSGEVFARAASLSRRGNVCMSTAFEDGTEQDEIGIRLRIGTA